MTLLLEWLPPRARLELVWFAQAQPALPPRPPLLAPILAVVVGPRQPPGSGVPRHLHTQSSPASIWTVNHNLGAQPAGVTVLTPGGVEADAEVVHLSVNQLLVRFASEQVGRVSII